VDTLRFALEAQSTGVDLMQAGIVMTIGGFALQTMGAALATSASIMAAATSNGDGTRAVLRDGYYYVNGFKYSQYYYERLWNTGRHAPSLISRMILEATKGQGVPDPVKEGFYRYVYDGWTLVYNPTTKEIWHLCQDG